MTLLRNTIKFYREAYHRSSRGIRLDNFFGNSGSLHFVPSDLELIYSSQGKIPVSTEWAQKVDKLLLLEGMEKDLLGGFLFLKGHRVFLGKMTKVFAPMYLFKLKLEQIDEVYFLEREQSLLNPDFFNQLKNMYPDLNLDFKVYSELLPSGIHSFDDFIQLRNGLSSLVPEFDLQFIDELIQEKHLNADLSKIYRSSKNDYTDQVIYGLAYGVFIKPTGSRGVLNELSEIEEQAEMSHLLQDIFVGGQAEQVKPLVQRPIHVPASLSEAQKQAFYALDQYKLSVINGPPGTGKSFTIAALVSEHVAKGESVIIASKNSQAGKVIARKLNDDFGLKRVFVNTERKSYRKTIINSISKVLDGIHPMDSERLWKFYEGKIIALNKEMRVLKKRMNRIHKLELKAGRLYAGKKLGLIEKVRKFWLDGILDDQDSLSESLNTYLNKEQNLIRFRKLRLRHMSQARLVLNLRNHRPQFVQLRKALEATKGHVIRSIFDRINFDIIFKALPVWICKSSDVSEIFPLTPNLVDVLIIDEASQSDIATSIPLLFRAKRVVIVGDAQQLRHVSFLGSDVEKNLLRQFELSDSTYSFRSCSILDVVKERLVSQDQLTFLDEHYRSLPSIIGFSNKAFYDNGLKVLKQQRGNRKSGGVYLINVPGERNAKGVNSLEADTLLKDIKAIVEEEASFSKSESTSLGIISPFTKQVTFLKHMISNSFELKILKKHNMLIGTPYHFQGEERDHMFISLVIDEDSPAATLNYLNKSDVFNVLITRARTKQFIYLSRSVESIKQTHLLRQLIDYIQNDTSKTISPDSRNIRDLFMDMVEDYVSTLVDCTIERDAQIFGGQLDLVVYKGDKSYAIDLVGYPGVYEGMIDLPQIRRMARIGEQVHFVSFWRWTNNKEQSQKELKKYLEVE